MRITKIEDQKNNKKRCSIFIDGEYYCAADKEIIDELNITEGMELNSDEFNRTMETLQYKSALRAAFYMLTRSSKTESDIRKKLKEKQYFDNTINAVLEYLKEIGYVNDNTYTNNYIKNTKDIAGTSKRSLYYKLVNKGVDKEIIQQELEEAEIDDYSSALKAAQKKAAGLKGDKRERAYKLQSFLYRKGYSLEVCRKVIDEMDLEES
jgi:regulatory protein